MSAVETTGGGGLNEHVSQKSDAPFACTDKLVMYLSDTAAPSATQLFSSAAAN